MATTIQRISPQQAYARLASDANTLLVCAYDSAEAFQQNQLEGAIALEELTSQIDILPRDRDIVFYCACPHEATSASRAEQFHSKGFHNAKVLAGGVEGWKKAGYSVVGTPR